MQRLSDLYRSMTPTHKTQNDPKGQRHSSRRLVDTHPAELHVHFRSFASQHSTAQCLRAGQRGFDSRQKHKIVLLASASRPALRPIQPPIQRELGSLSSWVKRPERKAGHSPPSSPEIKSGAMPPLPHTSSWRGT